MPEQTVQLALAIVAPQIHEPHDQCLDQLAATLQQHKGIQRAHIEYDATPPQLCIHYNPNLISLAAVERIAEQGSSEFSARYRHEQLPFVGMDAADAAINLTDILEEIPGVLHAQVNYAAGLIFVAYDTQVVDRTTLEQAIVRMGYKLLPTTQTLIPPHYPTESAHHEHAHGSAPTFLPHWMQERWSLILVGMAGFFFLIGWVGERFLGLPGNLVLLCYILAYGAGGYDIASHAIPSLLKGKFDTDVLMLAAAAGAALLGAWQEGAFLLFLFALGHAGEHYALDRARNAINALGALMPTSALVKRGDELRQEAVESLQVSDIVVVRPGDRVPADGVIRSGQSTLDQSPITGESVPVEKGPGAEVFAGTVNQSASLEVEVTKLAKDNTLSRVMGMVAEAQSQQSPTQQFTERFTAWFVPTVLVAVALVIVIPPLLGWMPLSESFYRAMLLLVAASPCALAIGTPAAVLSAIAQAARNGVLIKGGIHLENLGRLRVIAFDKTGTITAGKFSVTDVVPANGFQPNQVLQIAAAVERQSNHPLAQAVVSTAQANGLELPATNGLENVAGRGVRSWVDGQPVLIGSLQLFAETPGHEVNTAVVETVNRLNADGKTTMTVSQNGEFLGVLGLADQPRTGVSQTLQQLRQLGIEHLVMLTGDSETVAQHIAATIGVTDVRAELLPESKLEAIKKLQDQYQAVAMVGDGVNDAPALAAATVGVAMGGAGTAVALETADIALMADDLGRLPFAVGLSRASRAVIQQNLVIALGVIGLLVVTSVLGWVQLSAAVVLHEGSTILVVLNALRLLNYQLKETGRQQSVARLSY